MRTIRVMYLALCAILFSFRQTPFSELASICAEKAIREIQKVCLPCQNMTENLLNGPSSLREFHVGLFTSVVYK